MEEGLAEGEVEEVTIRVNDGSHGRRWPLWTGILLLLGLWLAGETLSQTQTVTEAKVLSFSPQGAVKGVRQVAARFSHPMVAMGTSSQHAPFVIDCPESGAGGWNDSRTWVYNFDNHLSAGVSCTFTQRSDLHTLDGTPMAGQGPYTVFVNGPAPLVSLTKETITEEQIFIFVLNAPVDWDSVPGRIHCDVEGVGEKMLMRLLTGQERLDALQQADPGLLDNYSLLDIYFKGRFDKGWGKVHADRLPKEASRLEKWLALLDWPDSPIVVAQCQRPLPNGAKVGVIWGKGIRATGGTENSQLQRLNFQVRKPFSAEVRCTRHNKNAHCVPILPIHLQLSEAIPVDDAQRIVMRGADGQTFAATLDRDEQVEWEDAEQDGEGPLRRSKAQFLVFPGPFPENSAFTVELPADIRDLRGRALIQQARTLPVRTDRIPSLAKFAGDFGVIEAKGDATLPVTVRDLEAVLPLASADPDTDEEEGEGGDADSAPSVGEEEGTANLVELRGRRLRVTSTVEFLDWMQRVKDAKRGENGSAPGREKRPGELSVFAHLPPEDERLETFAIPKPGGSKSLEVLGIPFQKPGLYIVELASDRLGAELHGEKKSYYAQSAVVVTNLAPHLKRGRNTSLVWVTTLDQGKPVADAEVNVHDCHGNPVFTGRSNDRGVLTIDRTLPTPPWNSSCHRSFDHGYLVSVRSGEDTAFLLSGWGEGITPYDFNLPYHDRKLASPLFSTVLDRSLLQAGDTLSMKHFARLGVETGLIRPDKELLPVQGFVRHTGSGQTYPFAIHWDQARIGENSWSIPREARFGHYQVVFAIPNTSPTEEVVTGQFWVEAFRMPTLRALINPVQPEQIAPTQMAYDLQLNHLSGGSVGAVPVQLRGMLRQKTVQFDGYEEYELANGRARESAGDSPTNPWERVETEEGGRVRSPEPSKKGRTLPVQSLTLNPSGTLRAVLPGLEPTDTPQELLAELEYQDTNGERLTSSSRLTLLPSGVLLGLRPEHWNSNQGELKLHVVALDRQGQPLANVAVRVDLLQQKYFSHRKRLLGGFYAYEHRTQINPVAPFCTGVTDGMGRLVCTGQSPVAGQVILQAQAADTQERASFAHTSVWVAKDTRWWFDVDHNNRMDLLPEKSRYEPGDEAVLQVRMPFPEATVLVTVEREGVLEYFVHNLAGDNPTLRIPMRDRYAPNVFISALAVRGRSTEPAPTARVDLGKPSFRMGYAKLNVGWQAHTLKVQVTTDRPVYKVRETAVASIHVTPPLGRELSADTELALAAVDEGLLELRANDSWNVLAAMMRPRAIQVETATALGRVIGRRHYGLKSVTHGGGGGRMPAGRQLLKPLLLWQGRVKLDAKGQAKVSIPLHEALSSFRVVAVASSGEELFGTGFTSFRTSQALAVHAGLPPLVREQDSFRAGFTVRNSSERPLQVQVTARLQAQPRPGSGPAQHPAPLAPIALTLPPGESQEVTWNITVPGHSQRLNWEVHALAAGSEDRLLVEQEVIPVVPVQVVQSTVSRLDKPQEIPVERPAAVPADRGGIRVHLQERLVGALDGVREYLSAYPYTCLEQRVSKAIVLQDEAAWQTLMRALPAFLDADGLAKYFPTVAWGSEVLTAYVLAIAHENRWSIPEDARQKMVNGLFGFVRGKIQRPAASPLFVSNLLLRKLAALEALSRHATIPKELLDSISVEPELWPTSAVLDWLNLLHGVPALAASRAEQSQKAMNVLRARLAFQGDMLGFSDRGSDALWWMMVSEDSTANRLLLGLQKHKQWEEDMPRLARGAMARQVRGHWGTTVANAWGVVAMKKFSEQFEAVAVNGKTQGQLAGTTGDHDWARQPRGGILDFPWPKEQSRLSLQHQGQGVPWVTVQSRAAISPTHPLFRGYRIQRSVTPVVRKVDGVWSRGDLLRVQLAIEAQSEMSWVVVNDPIPAGSSILGSGSGKDSLIMRQGEAARTGILPTFEERTFAAYRAYYERLPKGRWQLEYTLRLNNPGQFQLPATRVEAMYAPEMFGESPLEPLTVQP